MTIPEDFNPVERGEKAEEFFKQGYNCCQAVVLAFSDILPVDSETLATIASGFGGGFGRMREVCGAVSGMTVMAGFIQPATDHTSKTANYALVQEFATAYREHNGSIVCRELLGLAPGAPTPHVPADRSADYYKKRPCGQLVRIAATIVARKLLETVSIK